MYMNRIKKTRYAIFSYFQITIAPIFIILSIMGYYDMITDYDYVASFWGIFPVMSVIGASLLYYGIRNVVTLKSCNLLNECFMRDEDGIVTVKEISLRCGMSEKAVVKRLKLLIKRKCFVNVSVQYKNDEPVIILEDNDASIFRRNTQREEYTQVCCPNCGNVSMIKRGTIVNCRFCNGYLKGE